MTSEDLAALTAELEAHVAEQGWDQPPRLFALVRTGELVESEPHLAEVLGDADPDSITPVEQDVDEDDVGELLATIGWPPAVLGAALVNEVFLLPEEAEAAVPEGADPAKWAAEHPQRRDLRVSVAVLREGGEGATLRVRATEDGAPDEIVSQSGLVPNLAAALAATFEE